MYKKIFISTLLIAIFFPTASASAKPSNRKSRGTLLSKMSFGPQMGGSLSRITVTSSEYKEASFEKRGSTSSGNILWFTAGVKGEFYFLPQFGVAIELLYGRTGMYTLSTSSKVKQESIITPILVTYCTEQQGKGLQLQIGIQPSLALATTYYQLTGGKEEDLTEEEIEDADDAPKGVKLRSFDLALVGGLAYRFANEMEVGVRMSQGLLDRRELEAEHDSDDAEKSTWHAVIDQLYVGYNLAKFFK